MDGYGISQSWASMPWPVTWPAWPPPQSGTELRVQKRAARRANSAGRSLGPKGRSGIWGYGNHSLFQGSTVKGIPPNGGEKVTELPLNCFFLVQV